MATGKDLGARVLEIVQQTPGCDVDDLAAHCPDVTWNQVFLALDRLSRSGLVVLKQSGLITASRRCRKSRQVGHMSLTIS